MNWVSKKRHYIATLAVCTKDVPGLICTLPLPMGLLRQNVDSLINRPSLPATMDRGSWREAKTKSWSIHPFISRIPMQGVSPSLLSLTSTKPSHPSRDGGSHASNKSHHGHGNKPLRELLLKQALFHAVSYLVYHQFYQWDVMSWQWLYTRHIWFTYASSWQGREQKYQLQTCHMLSLG